MVWCDGGDGGNLLLRARIWVLFNFQCLFIHFSFFPSPFWQGKRQRNFGHQHIHTHARHTQNKHADRNQNAYVVRVTTQRICGKLRYGKKFEQERCVFFHLGFIDMSRVSCACVCAYGDDFSSNSLFTCSNCCYSVLWSVIAVRLKSKRLEYE